MVGKSLQNNFDFIGENIKTALSRSGRGEQRVQLVAVTKKQSVETIQDCLKIGLLDFGENYLQEALSKQLSFKQPFLRWHYIGSVQSKKVKMMLGKFYLWHGVDRMSVLEELNKRTPSFAQKVLLQVNIANEETKSGILSQDLLDFIKVASSLKGFTIQGLMTMPPLAKSEKQARRYFADMRELLEKCKKVVNAEVHPMNELSMGTSQDYTLAVEEGATIVRLGEALLGPRELGL